MLITEEIKHMVFKKNRNVIVVVTGEPGSGKSYTALKLAELLDPKLFMEQRDKLKERLTFKAEGFSKIVTEVATKARLVKEGRMTEEESQVYKGMVIVFEEAGVGMSADEFQTKSVKAITRIFQVFRFTNIILILTVPDLDYITKKARRRVQFHIEVEDYVNIGGGMEANKAKVFRVFWDPKTQQFYRYYLTDDKGAKLTTYYFKKASQPLLNRYEELAAAEKEEILEETQLDIDYANRKRKQKRGDGVKASLSVDDMVKRIRDEGKVKPKLFGGKYRYNSDSLRLQYGLTFSQARVIKEELEAEPRAAEPEKEKVREVWTE